MGLIKAASNAIGGALHDQWKDSIKCPSFDNETLSRRVTTSTGVISNKSVIFVEEGQLALLFDQGKLLDAVSEAGQYIYDSSTSPSIFAKEFKSSIKDAWGRFTFGGGAARNQFVIYINTKEILNNKFGLNTEYSDWGHPTFNPRNNQMYGMRVKIMVYGQYTFKISNPLAYVKSIGGTADVVKKDTLKEQMTSEFISSFRNTLAELGSAAYKIDALDLMHKDDEIVSIMKEKSFDAAIQERGIEIKSIAVENIKFDEESKKKIDTYELSDAYTAQATMIGAQATALQDAANNPNGAGMAMMGIGMGFGSMGINPMNNAQSVNTVNQEQINQQSQQAKSVQQPSSDTWQCSCGNTVVGKFCSECGSKKSENKTWQCSCGNTVTGKFCSECGSKKSENKTWQCSCGNTVTGKFCSECGSMGGE